MSPGPTSRMYHSGVSPAAAASVSPRIVATSGVTSSVTAILCLLHSPAISRATSRVYCPGGKPSFRRTTFTSGP